jgi:beta-lactamase regulating signal transducer with metallopeptidase domain
MNVLAEITSTPLVQGVGMALIHFGWQGLLIGSMLSITLIVMRDQSPNARDAVCLAAMLLMLLAPIVTTLVILFGVPPTLTGATDHALTLPSRSFASGWIVPLLPWITGFWVVGASYLQLRLIMSWFRARQMKYLGVRLLPASWQRDLDDLRARLGIERAVRILESSLVNVPSVIGWSRPIVLVPVDIMSTLTPPQLRAIIAHELAHIRRHDYLVNLLQNVFESVLFFHPVTWWVSDRLRAEREYCCDDIAVSACGSALNYAQALSSLEELRASETQNALASTGGDLMKRISRMLGKGTATSTHGGSWLYPLVSLVGVIMIAAVIATGCDSDAVDGPGLADNIVGPAVAAEPTHSLSDASLLPVAAQLEEYREAGLLTAEQAQTCLVKLGALIKDGAEFCSSEADKRACRVVVCPPQGSTQSCCPDGATVLKIQAGEDGAGRQINPNAPQSATLRARELDAEKGTRIARIRVEDGTISE